MNIGPISAIRPLPPVRPSPPGSDSGPDLSGVFAIEFRDQQRDDAYSPSRASARGLEDEEDPEEPESAEPSQSADSAERVISFFA